MNKLPTFFETGFWATSWGVLFLLALFVFLLWNIFWKGLAVWHAGRRGQPWWFIVLLVINTAGILEIIYLFGVIKLKPSQLFKK